MDATRAALETAYRSHASVLSASLTRLLGPSRLDAVEAVLHDTFVAALGAWSETGIPDVPAAWLMTAARRRALDELRRTRRELGRTSDAPPDDVPDGVERTEP